MDFEQIVKRLQWLDEEHRKDKAAIIALEEKIASYEGNIDTVAKQVKPLEKQISSFHHSCALDQFRCHWQNSMKNEKGSDELDKKYQKREKEITKQHLKDIEPFNKEIDELKKPLTELAPIKRDIKARITEEERLRQEIKELRPPIDEAIRAAEEQHAPSVPSKSRKQELKRIADLQGELTALHKRIDEA
jgi:chromosome segregation ATPase